MLLIVVVVVVEVEASIMCGHHGPATNCFQCPELYGGRNGCKGDCVWCDGTNDCQLRGCRESVDCGDHRATNCYGCIEGKGRRGCDGECKWIPWRRHPCQASVS